MMLRRLRWKFIGGAMLSMLAVTAVLLLSINLINTHYVNGMLDRQLERLVSTLEFVPPSGAPDPGGPSEFDPGKIRPGLSIFSDSGGLSRQAVNYFSVALSEGQSTGEADITHINGVTTSEAAACAAEAVASGKTSGQTGVYRYLISDHGDTGTVYFVDAGMTAYSLRAFRIVSCLVAAVSSIVMFVLVTLVSGRAIRPIAENYEKQKRFITDAGHELKTPLTIISANNEILRMNNGDSEWNDGISDQTARLSQLVNRMVTLSRLDEDKPPVAKSEFELSAAISETAKSFLPAAGTRGLALETEVEPDIRYRGDESAIRQLVSILLDNAVKYCDAGGTIAVTLTRGRRITLAVSNTYAELNGLETERMFDRFYRSDKARTGGGSYGLGLSIAKSIVTLHGGSIRALYQPGRLTLEVKL